MNPVALPSLSPGPKAPAGQSAPPAGPSAAAQARAPLHTDFRTLLRGQALVREPPLAAPARAPAGSQASRSTRPATGAAGERRAISPGSAGDDAADLAATGLGDDPLDPFARHRASLAPPDAIFHPPAPALAPLLETPPAAAPPEAPALRAATVSLEELLPALVRRVAWSGDGRSGAVRLELGSGQLAGATLLVQSDSGRVRVRLELPAGVDAAGWERRIRQRLEERRIVTDAVEVA
jgi:hypothetical protein